MFNDQILVIGDGLAARYLINLLNKKSLNTLQIVPVGKKFSELNYIDETNRNIFSSSNFSSLSGYASLGGRSIKWGGQLSLTNKIKTTLRSEFLNTLPNYPTRNVIWAWLNYSELSSNGVLLVKPKKFYESFRESMTLNERVYVNIKDLEFFNLKKILEKNKKNSNLESYEKIYGCLGSLGNLKLINNNPRDLNFSDHIYYYFKKNKSNSDYFYPQKDYVNCQGGLLRIEKIFRFENTELSIRIVNSFGKANKNYILGVLKDRYRRLQANLNLKDQGLFMGNYLMITDTLPLQITMNKIYEGKEYKTFKINENIKNRIKRISKFLNIKSNEIYILPSQHLTIDNSEKENQQKINSKLKNIEIIGTWDNNVVNYANPVAFSLYKIFCKIENYFK